MACSKGLSERLKEDRISQLPDLLICHILNHLRTHEVVRTSVLSSRWRSLWLSVPSLELARWKFPDFISFMSFGDRFFHSDRATCIQNVELSLDRNDASYLASWIDALTKRKIQRLSVERGFYHKMPLSLYVCETLVHLRLQWVTFVSAEFVFLPCLKTMYLNSVRYHKEATLERLVSSCPVLEDLDIFTFGGEANILRVHSQSLKRLTLVRRFSFDPTTGILIDAPQLGYLSIDDDLSESLVITNMDANCKLVLVFRSISFDEASLASQIINRFHSFLPGISKVRDMIIDLAAFKLICEYLKTKPLPRFGYMTRLHVTLCCSPLECLLTFLESFPNLKSLSLVFDYDKRSAPDETNQIIFSPVPECLLSSLEFVDFRIKTWERLVAMRLGRYFLENSAILKNLTLLTSHSRLQKSAFKELLKMPRGSTECEVVLDW
ncbi:PREDICTED: putative F-box/FBD/LRR-repeat protein At2g05300 [Camelina sativa]|uniref:F-box/FBD/LRR-repeat protein At2g05300 n=1 Tax=Camelina sativa TaxID=90675 RepID=A0ABM0Y755_CAMSA|nr:PREDICTED: putative F-box/FBD/LRR-repeat protein At2g05300 [Camelina sativa]